MPEDLLQGLQHLQSCPRIPTDVVTVRPSQSLEGARKHRRAARQREQQPLRLLDLLGDARVELPDDVRGLHHSGEVRNTCPQTKWQDMVAGLIQGGRLLKETAN